MKTLQTILILLCFAVTTTFAQAPQAFNYQGVARDLNGNPMVNQSISLRASILSGSSNGTIVYQEAHHILTSSLGLFNIAIGEGSASVGTMAQIDWNSDSHFIRIEIDEKGGTDFKLVGSSQLLSVPYALNAGNTLWRNSEVEPGSIYYSDKVRIGGDYTHPAMLSVTQNDPELGPFTNTLLADFKREYQGSTAALGVYGYPNSDLVYPHLRGSIMLYAAVDARDLVLCADDDFGNIRFVTRDWYNAANERMRIDYRGNVGIGTTDPITRLHIGNGDILVEDPSRGVIMRSPNGTYWRMTVDDNGQPVFTSVVLPD